MAMIAPPTTYRYQAGTCTLSLTGERSALSQVSDRPLLRRSRFRLEVWPEELEPEGLAAIAIQGDPRQLLGLREQVQHYLRMVPQGPHRGPWQVVVPRPMLSLQRRNLQLSTLQLADLSEVLEQMDRGIALLSPEILPQRRSSARAVSLGTVAAGLVAAVVGSQWLVQAPRPLGESLVRSPASGPSHLSLPYPTPRSPDVAANQPGPIPAAPLDLAPVGPPLTTPKPTAAPTQPSPPTPAPIPQPQRTTAPSQPPGGTETLGDETLGTETLGDAPSSRVTRARPYLGPPAWLDSLGQALPTTWLAPEGLDQPLRYRLTLAPNGQVEAVEPLGDLAKQYQPDLDLPRVGDIPTALSLEPATQVEVIFWPNGRVQLREPSAVSPSR